VPFRRFADSVDWTRPVAVLAMPSFVLSLTLLLLVVLALLAVSNRELIALTFLGVSTIALPLSVWIVGAIAAGFLLGLWILLLFRFGTVGAIRGSDSGAPFRSQRRTNYGPEDFAVVDERFAEGEQHEAVAGKGYGDRQYDDARDGSRYNDNRYDDIYNRGQYPEDSRGQDYSQERGYADDRGYAQRQNDSGQRSYDPASYDSASYGSDYDSGRYSSQDRDEATRDGENRESAQEEYGDRPSPQDEFSAASGYGGTGNWQGQAQAQPGLNQDIVTQNNPVSPKTILQLPSQEDPTVPADWDDPYREDWTEAELIAEPVLRNETTEPKLKRWFSNRTERSGNEQELSEPVPSEAERSQPETNRPVKPNPVKPNPVTPNPVAPNDVYDADYRVVQQPSSPPTSEPPRPTAPPQQPASQPSSSQDNAQGNAQNKPSSRSDRASSEWDIESDLDW